MTRPAKNECRLKPQALANFHRASQIIRVICRDFKVTPAQLESPCRRRQFYWPRSIASALIRAQTSYTYSQIGLLLNRCHSSITYEIRAYRNQLETSRTARADLDRIAGLLWSLD